MTQVFERGKVTTLLVGQLEQMLGPDILVGDLVAPLKGGWMGGQPGAGDFLPYVVVLGGRASRENETLGFRGASWRVSYQLRSTGATREQADWTLDRARNAFMGLERAVFSVPDTWGVAESRVDQMGDVSRIEAADPPYYETTDSVSIWLDLQ